MSQQPASKRTRATRRTAFVYDFESDAADGVPPPEQKPIQLAYSILELESGHLEELAHGNLFISDQAEAIGPFHEGRFTLEQIQQCGKPMRDVAALIIDAIVSHNVSVLAAHNGSGMDFPHLRRLVGSLQDDHAAQIIDALHQVDTMLDTVGRTAFLPAQQAKRATPRKKNDAYPSELTILRATMVDGEPLRLRVRYEDPNHTLFDIAGTSQCGKWALRFHFDDANESVSVAGVLLNYDAVSNPRIFTFDVCAEELPGREYTIQVFTDWRREKPLVALADEVRTFTNASASPLIGYTLKFPKQDELLARYGIENTDAHDGSADVRALCELLRRGPWDNRTLRCTLPSDAMKICDGATPGSLVQFEYDRGGELALISGTFLGAVVFSHKSWGLRVRVGDTGNGVRCYGSAKINRFETLCDPPADEARAPVDVRIGTKRAFGDAGATCAL